MSHNVRGTRSSPTIDRSPDPGQPALGPGKQTLVEQLQRHATGPGPSEGGPKVDAALASSSQPLDAGARGMMESKLHHDFSGVRVHTDSTAAAGAASVQAKAFTVGSDIVFGSGQYQPHSTDGRRLLAHELTHVAQQGGGGHAPEVARSPQAQGADQAPAGELRGMLGAIAQLLSAASSLPDPLPELASAQAELPKLRSVAGGSDPEAISEALETLQHALGEAGVTAQELQRSAANAAHAPAAEPAHAPAAAAASPVTVQTPTQLAAKSLSVSQPGDAAEVEAERVADSIDTDRPASIGHAADPGIHRLLGPLRAAGSAAIAQLGRVVAELHRRFIAEPRARREATALETSDHAANPHAGHSLGRHGPQVSDAQLQSRLTTGVAPDTAFSPAPGTSSRFNSHIDYMQTRQAAATAAATAIANTQGLLVPLLNAYETACVDFLNEPPGPGKGAKGAARNTARVAVTNAANTITNPSTTQLAVVVQNFPLTGATPVGDVPGLVAGMVTLRATYKVVVDHARDIGTAFVGTGAPTPAVHPTTGAAGPGQVWPGTAPAPAAPQRTRTTFGVPVNSTLIAPPAPATWTAIQHFPAEPTEPVGIGY